MVESQLKTMNPEMYERLIDRLGLALEAARTAVRLRDEVPTELEIRGLTRAEYEWINAFLETNRSSQFARSGAAPVASPRASAKVVWLKDKAAARASLKGRGARFQH